jgi:hypothetical protein
VGLSDSVFRPNLYVRAERRQQQSQQLIDAWRGSRAMVEVSLTRSKSLARGQVVGFARCGREPEPLSLTALLPFSPPSLPPSLPPPASPCLPVSFLFLFLFLVPRLNRNLRFVGPWSGEGQEGSSLEARPTTRPGCLPGARRPPVSLGEAQNEASVADGRLADWPAERRVGDP